MPILSTEYINQITRKNLRAIEKISVKLFNTLFFDAIFSHANENYYVCANLENYRENNKSGGLQSIIPIRMYIFSCATFSPCSDAFIIKIYTIIRISPSRANGYASHNLKKYER